MDESSAHSDESKAKNELTSKLDGKLRWKVDRKTHNCDPNSGTDDFAKDTVRYASANLEIIDYWTNFDGTVVIDS